MMDAISDYEAAMAAGTRKWRRLLKRYGTLEGMALHEAELSPTEAATVETAREMMARGGVAKLHLPKRAGGTAGSGGSRGELSL